MKKESALLSRKEKALKEKYEANGIENGEENQWRNMKAISISVIIIEKQYQYQ
jgi:hypothetical protein